MEKDFFRDILEKNGITVMIPDMEGRNQVHDIIYKELVNGIITDESKKTYVTIIENLIAAGAEGVILGCTEIPLLIKPVDVNIPLFNTTRIHAERAVEIALEGS